MAEADNAFCDLGFIFCRGHKKKMARGYRPVSNEMEQKFSPKGKIGVFNL
jgi:hypothetical protein